jgi:hypothetical protein
MVGETVRREKPLDYSACNSRPGTGSLHLMAIECSRAAPVPLLGGLRKCHLTTVKSFTSRIRSATQGRFSVPEARLIVGCGENRVVPPIREVFPNWFPLEQVL